MNTVEFIFLQAGGGAGLQGFLFPALLIGVFYIFFILPQTRKQKKQKAFQEGLEKGAKVVTASGILGQINKIEDDIITLEVGSKTFIQITRNAISQEMTEAVYSPKPEKK